MHAAGIRGAFLFGGLVACGGSGEEGVEGANGATDSDEPTGETDAPVVDDGLRSERFEQTVLPALDVLWVVDNSGSMQEEQEDLGAAFPVFLQAMLASNLDYHVGVVSTDMANVQTGGQLVEVGSERWISPETPDPEQTFAEMSNLGTLGSPDEQGLLAAYVALEYQREWNAGFLRDDSVVQVVVVSDEGDFTPANLLDAPTLIAYLDGMRPDPELVSFHSIVAVPGDLCPSIAMPGSEYIAITDAVGGVTASLCDRDMIGALTAIGAQLGVLRPEYVLAEVPIAGTTVVTLTEAGSEPVVLVERVDDAPGDWTWSPEANSVVLERVPALGAVTEVTYEVAL